MEVQYKCNAEDYREAQYVALKRSVSYYVMFVGGGLFLLFGVFEAFTVSFWSSVPLLSIAAVWFAYAFFYLPFKLKRDFLRHPNFARDCRLRVDEDGFWSESDVSTGEVKWAAFVKFRETPNLFMLYLGGRMFKVVPKRALSASQLEEFRELLRRKLPVK